MTFRHFSTQELSAEDFQVKDDSKTDDSFIKRDFKTVYHQHRTDVNIENQNIKFFFGQNHKFKQKGNGFFEVDNEVIKVDNKSFTYAGQITLVITGLAYTSQEARLSRSSATEVENNKNLGTLPTIMRLLTQKHRDLSSYFDKSEEREAGISNSSVKHQLTDSHSNEDNKEKLEANFPLELFLASERHLKK